MFLELVFTLFRMGGILRKNVQHLHSSTYDSQELDVTYQTKLLGVICCSDGKWDQNAKYLAGKGNSRHYFLRRLKDLGACHETLKEVYLLFVRSILDMCAPLWSGALSKSLSDVLEMVQRSNQEDMDPHPSPSSLDY